RWLSLRRSPPSAWSNSNENRMSPLNYAFDIVGVIRAHNAPLGIDESRNPSSQNPRLIHKPAWPAFSLNTASPKRMDRP
ncbi:MAG: hypothetical protein KC931_25400, partial [Candidatus Omnitrophica bacterium]|nr:hypothetical protein [Candidatus Omnitrophota bacterium]